MATEPDGPYYLDEVYIPEESDDGFEYREISVEELSVSEGEESLEAAVKAARARTDDAERVWDRSAGAPVPPPLQQAPELLEDFVRNFLQQTGLSRTFDCFQTEWFELLQKKDALGAHKAGALVPDAHAHNRLLRERLEEARKEGEAHREAAARAERSAEQLKKERDYHRLQHLRLLQEKKRLAEELKRLRRLYEL